jgi:hypothetical protein
MATLPSGLPEVIADSEDLSRFLTQSSHFNSVMAKPAAFLPNPKYRNTSVFRCGADPERIRQIWQETTDGQRSLKAAAVFTAMEATKASLSVVASEPPPAHANLEGWPWLDSDPELQKAKQVELAAQLAQASILVRW